MYGNYVRSEGNPQRTPESLVHCISMRRAHTPDVLVGVAVGRSLPSQWSKVRSAYCGHYLGTASGTKTLTYMYLSVFANIRYLRAFAPVMASV